MDLSVAIVSWNTREVLDQCLKSVYDTTTDIDFEVIVVDNCSSDGSADMVRATYPQSTLIANEDNAGFAKANNQALDVSTGRYFMLLNPDTICLDGALGRMARFLDAKPNAGAVGPLVLNADTTLQYSWARFPTLWSEAVGRLDRGIQGNSEMPLTADQVRAIGSFQTDWVGGCCLMIRRAAVDVIGPMDESLFMYSEETDWCLRLRKNGWDVWVEPEAEIIHLGNQSSMQVPTETSRYLRCSKSAYFTKHHGAWQGHLLGTILALKFRCKRGFAR